MKLKEPLVSKICPSCCQTKDLSAFAKTSHTKTGYQSWCKKCVNAQTLKRHIRLMAESPEYKEKRRARSLEGRYKYKYGITLQEKINMIASQKSLCAMCNKVLEYRTSVLDHNHNTEKVRAILCIKCNTGLSYIENEEFLKLALEYLKNHEN